jgi:hypothetical protein
LGYVDSGFTGFDVELAIQATGQAPVYATGTLLPTGVGNNPRGTSYIEAYLPQAITGTWVLRVTWTNYLTLPIQGWTRSLAIYSITTRQVATNLYQVSLNPAASNPLAISQVSVSSPNVNDPAPGAWVTYLNSLGQPVSWTHESQLYATTQGLDTYNNPSRPAANSLTASTNWKDDLFVRNPATAPNLTYPAGPGIQNLYALPSKPLYNVSDNVTFISTGTGGYGNLRYLWYLPGGTAVTSTGTWATAIPSSGTYSLTSKVVDAHGTAVSGTLPLNVNVPPAINYLTATPNNTAAPFQTTLFASTYYASGSVGKAFNVSWYSGTQFIGTGTSVGTYPVNQTQTVTAYAFDHSGGTSTATMRLVASDANPPVVSLATFPNVAIGLCPVPITLSFYGIAADPDNKGVATVWDFWDGYQTPGFTQALPGFGSGTLCSATRTIPSPGVPLGYQLFNLTATNLDGLSTSAGAGIDFIMNQIPQLTSLTVSDPGVVTGTNVYYAAVAISPLNNVLNYTWTFQSLNQVLYGPNVALTTAGMPAGSTVNASLQINDNFGGVITPTVPIVNVYAQGVGQLFVTPGTGSYTTGVSASVLGSGIQGQIYYTLDGTDPTTNASIYTSPVVISPTAGNTVVFTARSFLSGYAPSPKVTAVYTFT